jgi:hypothetical protein
MRNAVQKSRRRAKLPEWDKFLHNLRASRQTELEDEVPTHYVCAWLGNTPAVARKSYLKITPEMMSRFTKTEAKSEAIHIHTA